MTDKKLYDVWCSPTDPSIEFDVFEGMRLKLAKTFEANGYDTYEAARIALYVVQGVRHIPHLLKVLDVSSTANNTEIVEALGMVVDEATALEKARRLLLRQKVE
jgi:hypothetical protein